MKKTLKENLLIEIKRIDQRIDMLNMHIKDYKENNDYENAMKCDIKWRQLKMVSQSLKKIVD